MCSCRWFVVCVVSLGVGLFVFVSDRSVSYGCCVLFALLLLASSVFVACVVFVGLDVLLLFGYLLCFTIGACVFSAVVLCVCVCLHVVVAMCCCCFVGL